MRKKPSQTDVAPRCYKWADGLDMLDWMLSIQVWWNSEHLIGLIKCSCFKKWWCTSRHIASWRLYQRQYVPILQYQYQTHHNIFIYRYNTVIFCIFSIYQYLQYKLLWLRIIKHIRLLEYHLLSPSSLSRQVWKVCVLAGHIWIFIQLSIQLYRI